MVQSEDARKSWLLERACKGLAVPESLCDALLIEDQAQIDLSTFLKGGVCIVSCNLTPACQLIRRQDSFHAGSASALLVYLEQVSVFAPKASTLSLSSVSASASARASILAE